MNALRLAAVSCAVLVCPAIHAQTVYENSRIVAYSRPTGIHFQISKDGHPPPFFDISCVECYTELTFAYDGTRLKAGEASIDEVSDWFLVQPGDTFSRATINAGQFPVILNLSPTPHGGEGTVGSGEFHLGVRTGRGLISNRTAYGWVHLRPVDGVLTMVENVMSYNSRGIIVGTTTVVPEPHTMALVGIAASSIAFGTIRRRFGKNESE